MRICVFVVVMASAIGAHAEDARTPLLILDFKHDQADARTARVLNEVVATTAAKTERFAVTTSADLAQAMDLEGEKAAMGCDTESSSCLAEIAGAMGAELVLFGDVGTLGRTTLVSLNLFDNNTATSIGRETVRSAKIDELPGLIEDATEKLLGAGAATPGAPPLFVSGLATTGAGVLVLGVGLGLAGIANTTLESPSSSKSEKEIAFAYGVPSFWVGLVGGGALVAGGALMAGLGATE